MPGFSPRKRDSRVDGGSDRRAIFSGDRCEPRTAIASAASARMPPAGTTPETTASALGAAPITTKHASATAVRNLMFFSQRQTRYDFAFLSIAWLGAVLWRTCPGACAWYRVLGNGRRCRFSGRRRTSDERKLTSQFRDAGATMPFSRVVKFRRTIPCEFVKCQDGRKQFRIPRTTNIACHPGRREAESRDPAP